MLHIFCRGAHEIQYYTASENSLSDPVGRRRRAFFFLFNLYLDVNLHISKEKPVSLCGL